MAERPYRSIVVGFFAVQADISGFGAESGYGLSPLVENEAMELVA